MSKFLSRATILGISDIETTEVEVKEWGGSVLVTGLNGTEKSDYEASLITRNGTDIQMNMKNAMVKLLALTIVDEDGTKLFESADIEALGKKSGKALARVYKVAANLSGLSEEDVKELTKNSKSIPKDSSISS